ncbi:MAG TPA: oligopeptide transporter, OPT family [Planctomycetes bacterium]|nr:oligopeptide transporter, OPT family [Planctomycetota bacterium]
MTTEPVPASSAEPPETTLRAILLGVGIGCVMATANVYLGLFAGMTVSASIPAAVISMGILRGLFKDGTVLENNIVQTIASAGESLAAGIIFTMPALVIAGVWTDFDFWTTTLVSITGGLLGVLFMIPLRKPMIIEDEELTYPEGVACAKVLRAGEDAGGGMGLIFTGLGVAALVKLATDALSLMAGEVKAKLAFGKAYVMGGAFAAPAMLGVGFIVGLNISLLVFVGGAISWVFAGPVLTSIDYQGVLSGVTSATGHVDVDALAKAVKPHLRFLGVGAMVVGGLWSILMIRNGIVRGIEETIGGYRASMKGAARPARVDTDMEPRWILFLLAATTLIVAILYEKLTGHVGIASLATVLMVISSFFFVAVASYIVGLVGSSNSPVSGMTICAVLFTSAFVFLFGYSDQVAILATMGVAGVVCCATCTAGDVCQDLKTGSLVGATPKRQQWAEILGVVTASFVMWFVLNLLHKGRGIGTDAHIPLDHRSPDGPLEAPQAQLFANLMKGFFGDAPLPWGLIGIGAGVGVLIILIDQLVLRPRRSRFRLHVMPVAVGMYLPFGLSTTILFGGLLAWFAGRGARSEQARGRGLEKGVILASGLIAGEAMAGVLTAVPRALKWTIPQLLSNHELLVSIAVVVMVLLATWLVRVSRPKEA